MDYTIYPCEGVGPIRFGMTPQQVHEILGEPEGSSTRRPESRFLTDYYEILDLHVVYKESGECKADLDPK